VKLTIIREGCTANQWRDAGGESWRSWAYEAAVAQAARKMTPPVLVTVTPTARDTRGRQEVGSCWLAVDKVLDGLVSAGVIGGRRDDWIVGVNYRMTDVTGEDGLRVTLDDAAEPF